jgi:hypothetical protein
MYEHKAILETKYISSSNTDTDTDTDNAEAVIKTDIETKQDKLEKDIKNENSIPRIEIDVNSQNIPSITNMTKLQSGKLNIINPSICIPRVDTIYKKDYIYSIFYKLNIGVIQRIDTIYNYKTNTYRVFIHFKNWKDNEKSKKIKDIILNEGYFKLVYNFPEYWKCYYNKASHHN